MTTIHALRSLPQAAQGTDGYKKVAAEAWGNPHEAGEEPGSVAAYQPNQTDLEFVLRAHRGTGALIAKWEGPDLDA